MFCRNCGKEISDAAAICVNCQTIINPAILKKPQPVAQPAVAQTKRTNGFALTGFILSFFGIAGILFSIGGLIFSILGLVRAKEVNAGKGFGIAGIVISVCAFFVHGIILMLIIPFLIKLAGALLIVLLLLIIL